GPEEITQTAGEGVRGQRAAGNRRAFQSILSAARVEQIEAEGEVGRHEHSHDRLADGFLMGQPAFLAKASIIRQNVLAFGARKRSAVCPSREFEKSVQMARFRFQSHSLYPPERVVDPLEMKADGFHRDRIIAGFSL